ncbi:MAG: hypothetical protein ACRDVC_03145 [Acidimicrobiales bacterium]
MTDWFGTLGERVTWHVVWAAITTWVLTAIGGLAHVRVTVAGALVATSQVPGPRNGTSATSKVELSCPLTTPLEALAANAFTLDLALEAVTPEELLTRTALVDTTSTVGLCDRIILRESVTDVRTFVGFFTFEVLVVVVTGIVVGGVEVTVRAFVLGGGTVEESSRRGGVELDEAVKVKTRTKRRTGLDHITQCVLFSECGGLIRVLAG